MRVTVIPATKAVAPALRGTFKRGSTWTHAALTAPRVALGFIYYYQTKGGRKKEISTIKKFIKDFWLMGPAAAPVIKPKRVRIQLSLNTYLPKSLFWRQTQRVGIWVDLGGVGGGRVKAGWNTVMEWRNVAHAIKEQPVCLHKWWLREKTSGLDYTSTALRGRWWGVGRGGVSSPHILLNAILEDTDVCLEDGIQQNPPPPL